MLPILALGVALGIFIIFLGIARTPQVNTAQMVQQRLGSFLSRSTPQKARQDLMNKLDLAGRPGNLTPEDFGAVRIVGAAVLAAVGLLLGFLFGNPVYL